MITSVYIAEFTAQRLIPKTQAKAIVRLLHPVLENCHWERRWKTSWLPGPVITMTAPKRNYELYNIPFI
jgi:hypothetical protein